MLITSLYFGRGGTDDQCGQKITAPVWKLQQHGQQHQQLLQCGQGGHQGEVLSHHLGAAPSCFLFTIISSSRTTSYFWTHVETTFLSGHMSSSSSSTTSSSLLHVSRCVVRSSILLRAGDSSRLSGPSNAAFLKTWTARATSTPTPTAAWARTMTFLFVSQAGMITLSSNECKKEILPWTRWIQSTGRLTRHCHCLISHWKAQHYNDINLTMSSQNFHYIVTVLNVHKGGQNSQGTKMWSIFWLKVEIFLSEEIFPLRNIFCPFKLDPFAEMKWDEMKWGRASSTPASEEASTSSKAGQNNDDLHLRNFVRRSKFCLNF